MIKRAFLLIFTLALLFTNVVYGATKENVLSAIRSTYNVGESTFRLPKRIISKAESYLSSHELTSEQCDTLLGCINRAVAIAQRNGTTDIKKFSKEDIREGVLILATVSKTVKVNLSQELAENNISISQINENAQIDVKEEQKSNDLKNDNKVEEANNAKSVQKNVETKSQNEKKDLPNSVDDNLEENDNRTEIIDQKIENISDFSDQNQISQNDDNAGIPLAKSVENIEKEINIKLILIGSGIVLIIFLFIFIFCLIFKSKWYKIVKYIVMIILVILILVALTTLVLFLTNIEEIRTIYEFYYIFK